MKIVVSITLTVLVLVALTAIALSGQSTPAESGETAALPETKNQDAPPSRKPVAKEVDVVYALMDTSLGDIVLELDRGKAPETVRNFQSYMDKRFYDGTVVHRVMANFMIQGGGFTADLQRKPTDPPIKNEWRNGLKNARGTIAMARTTAPDSATSQFFINVVDNSNLDQPISGGAGYAVFGRVVAGMDVVDAIRSVTTAAKGPHQHCPAEPVIIEHVKPLSADEARKRIERDPAQKGGGAG